MMRLLRAVVVIAGLSVALPALGGELPLLIVASDFDLVIGRQQPAPRHAEQPTPAKPRSAVAKKPVAVAAVAVKSAPSAQPPRAMK